MEEAGIRGGKLEGLIAEPSGLLEISLGLVAIPELRKERAKRLRERGVHGVREVADQNARVAVLAIKGEPCTRKAGFSQPINRERRLPVARRGTQNNNWVFERVAETMETAVAALRREQIFVTRINPTTKAAPSAKKEKAGKLGKRVPTKNLAVFTRQF